jgi:NAD(P)H dehydrogenase (quinone)
MSNILVTGATGPLGLAVTNTLLEHLPASEIRILVRNTTKPTPANVEKAIGDYDDYNSLLQALKGISRLFLVSGSDVEKRRDQQLNVIKAAIESGVKYIVYVSLQRKNDSLSSKVADKTIAHLDTEKAIFESGIAYTILKYALYAEMIPIFAGEQLLDTRTIFLPAGQGRAAYALRNELGEAGAKVLLDKSGRYTNRVITLSGPEAVSWQGIANMLSEIKQQPFTYVSPTPEAFINTLTQSGAPAWLGPALASMQQAVAEGEYSEVTPDLENILGRKPTSVYDYLKSIFGK